MWPFVTICDHFWSQNFSDKKMEIKLKKNLKKLKKSCLHKKKMWPKFPNVHGCARAHIRTRMYTIHAYVRTYVYACMHTHAHIRVHSEILVTFFFYGDNKFSEKLKKFRFLSPFFYPKFCVTRNGNKMVTNGHNRSQMVTLLIFSSIFIFLCMLI